ncbi:hypothetical protein AAFF_G00022610 [Aldrovandia affinis]|uniref:Uncharacterized protein n=1 Tax=Aldrovandia affinis TaxID=143900 RepID=A0AAD7T673_9TELE|nr:hypothetical protein AAFF_G00022610 [Aldrovandia affinis]
MDFSLRSHMIPVGSQIGPVLSSVPLTPRGQTEAPDALNYSAVWETSQFMRAGRGALAFMASPDEPWVPEEQERRGGGASVGVGGGAR